jgi:hypothetical protein
LKEKKMTALANSTSFYWPAGWFQIRVAHTDLNDPTRVTYYPYVVAVENDNASNGARVVMATPKAGSLGQLWRYTEDFRLINGLGSNLVLALGSDVADGKQAVVASQGSPVESVQQWMYGGIGNPFSLVNLHEQSVLCPQPGSEPGEGVPIVAANSEYNTWSFWYAVPASQMTYVLRRPPIAFPAFEGEEARAYDVINTLLGLSQPLRTLYTETNRPWSTWQSEISLMAVPSGIDAVAWARVKEQLKTELTYVESIQKTIDDWKQFNDEFMSDKSGLLNSLGIAAGMEVGGTTPIGGALLNFFTGLMYTALSTEPELALLANLFQTGINVAQASGDTRITPDPFQVAYYELWTHLSNGFEDMLSGIDHMGHRMLTDWGVMQAAIALINERGPDSLAWRVGEDARLLKAAQRGFIVSCMQMLLPAKYMIYKYFSSDDAPVSGVPDYAQWIQPVGSGWFKYWIADGTDWGLYPSAEAMQNSVWDQGVAKSDFFQCKQGWSFATSFTNYYRGLTEAGMAVTLTNHTTNLLLARLSGVEDGDPKTDEFQTLPPGESVIMACLGTSMFYGPTMTLEVYDPSVSSSSIQLYSAHQKVPVFTGTDLTIEVTVPEESFGYRTATPICWASAQNSTYPSTSGGNLSIYQI